MPILNLDEEVIPNITLNTDHTYVPNEELKAGSIFNKDTDITGIVGYVSGSKWEVDFFTQVRDINTEPTLPDVNLPNTVLSYNRINKLILNVQSDLTQVSAADPLIGEAIINSGMVPNYGDAFKAVLIGGREAIFVITSVDKKIYDIHEVYHLVYQLHVFLDTDTVVYNDLVYKTLKEYVYDKDYLADYSSPVILATDYKKKVELKDEPKRILNYYLNTFINTELNIIALPTVSSVYVDTYLNKFLFKIINVNDNEKLLKLNKLDYINSDLKESVWDIIINRDIDALTYVERDIGFKYTPYNSSNPNNRQVGYLGINFVCDMLYGTAALVPEVVENKKYDSTHIDLLNIDLNGYLFSDSFYDTQTSTGILEQGLLNYLKGELIPDDTLDKLLASYKVWSVIEQYYFIPVLLLLISEKVRYTYKSI